MSAPASALGMRQLPLDLGPATIPGLDQFIAGDNEHGLAWLRQWPPAAPRGLVSAYFWGPTGCGKTHLLRAMVPQALERGYSVLWVGAQGCQPWPAPDPEAPTLALLDDCDQLDEHLQHLAFNLFIEAASNPPGFYSLIAAGAVPPVDLPVRDDLRTRLGWGQIFALSPLDEAGVREALQAEATRRGIFLAEGVLFYLLTRYSRDLRFLMGLLDRLDRFALAEHRTVTVPLLKQMLALETE